MTDEARAVAVAEVAKTTGEIVRAAGGVGAYLAKVFGSIPEDVVGLGVGDWLNQNRQRHLAILEDNTARLLEGIAADPAERLTEPSPNVLIALLRASVDEGRPELQAIWAALLANAILDGGRKVRRDYFAAVRQMEPADALALDIAHRCTLPDVDRVSWIVREFLSAGLAERDLYISMEKLRSLNVASPLGSFTLSQFGLGLVDACAVG
jgi:hypothetical protein